MPPSTLEAIEAAALQLSTADRNHLTERLLASLEQDDEIMAEWFAEAQRRGESHAQGEEGASDISAVIARMETIIATHARKRESSSSLRLSGNLLMQ